MTDALLQAYAAATSKLLLLDYDGVLAPIVARPEQARPTPEVLEVLEKIAAQPGVKIVIISGRDRKTLENWLGSLSVEMSAEHGHFYKESGTWFSVLKSDMTWAKDVELEMQQLTEEYPGSYIESKQASLVWHYRQVRKPVDAFGIQERLERVVSDRAVVMTGKRVIDVRAPGADKGRAVRHWYDQQAWDFVLCIGDDLTDEAMFLALPEPAWTFKVGKGPTSARYIFNHQEDVITLLREMTK